MAAAAGVPLQLVRDLDDAELEAYAHAVGERLKQQAWGYTEELLAEVLRMQHAVLIQLNRGIPVVLQKKQRKGGEPLRVDRPEWITGKSDNTDVVVVTSVRGLAALLS